MKEQSPSIPKILWVDDKIAIYSELIEILENNGLDVDIASSANEALEKCISHNYDLYIIDLKMDEINGLGLINRLQERYKKIKLVVLSSFLHQHKFKLKLLESKVKMFIMEKKFPDDEQLLLDEFVNPIKRWIKEQPKLIPTEYFDKRQHLVEETENPLLMHFKDFISLPESQRMKLADKVEKKLNETLKREFSKGNIWVLICGDENEPIRTARTIKEIPPNEEILNIAKANDLAFFEFSAPIGAESLKWDINCENNIQYTNYPTLNIILSPDQEDHSVLMSNFRVHFDTGSPETFFSYEKLIDIGKKIESSSVKRGKRLETGEVYLWVRHDLTFLVQNDLSEDQQIGVTIVIQAVKNWEESPWIKTCPDSCSNGVNIASGKLRGKLLCINRFALIGNNIFEDNDIILELHGANKSTGIRRSANNSEN